MGLIFKINEELASIAVTSTELLAVSKTTVQFIKNKDFVQQLSAIILEINRAYTVVDNSFTPFFQLNSEAAFAESYDTVLQSFKDNYLMEISKPRKYFDNVYESYVDMQQAKEAKTGFPMVKNNFIRLNELYDKWINNDAYLAMSIDRAIKLENNLLNEIAGQKEKDVEDAYIIFQSTFDDFKDYLTIINNNKDRITNCF